MSDVSLPVPYDTFLTEDPRRRQGEALEIGHDFADEAGGRYRVCWYAETAELTFERLEHDDVEALDLEDFHRGIATAEVVAQFDRETLERVLGAWPQVEHCEPRTLARVRELLTFA